MAVAEATDNEYTTTAMNRDLPPNHERIEGEAHPRQPQNYSNPPTQEHNPQHYQQYPTHQYPQHYQCPPHQHHYYPPDPQYGPYHYPQYPQRNEQLQYPKEQQQYNNNNIPIERTSTHDTEMQEVIVEAIEYAQRAENKEENNGELKFCKPFCAYLRIL